jgi:hypothetical protein
LDSTAFDVRELGEVMSLVLGIKQLTGVLKDWRRLQVPQ